MSARTTMKTLLRMDVSLRVDGSHSLALGDFFQQKWQEKNPDGKVAVRDLGKNPVPHISLEMIMAAFTPPEERSAAANAALALSDELVDELFAADDILISTPLYNFTEPTPLKAWVDHIIRKGRTFDYGAEGPYGLLPPGKRVWACLACGGVISEGPRAGMDHLRPTLRTQMDLIGIEHVECFVVEGTNTMYGVEAMEASFTVAKEAILDALRN